MESCIGLGSRSSIAILVVQFRSLMDSLHNWTTYKHFLTRSADRNIYNRICTVYRLYGLLQRTPLDIQHSFDQIRDILLTVLDRLLAFTLSSPELLRAPIGTSHNLSSYAIWLNFCKIKQIRNLCSFSGLER